MKSRSPSCRELTDLVAAAANDPGLKTRTWVLLTEATPGGLGLWGHAHTNDELVGAARAEIASFAADDGVAKRIALITGRGWL